ncbi:CRISPR-associated protein Cas_Cmr5 [Enhygromyxa salina]|uniref:CRISPR type III-B/RAMP module-associated protein Cmr5 n=1 Tax=Enhygromyxa salina TaxID=215803 RepID=A0A2S9XFH5_9BACT|nr:type III-B CRISPR module-associated protein Cmr5 [Enhygromyxa salina]PRP91421.1 CRISPR-associated protein Cas_Cmr5 [Enhygromyxa salina]
MSILRDQEWACLAYTKVAAVEPDQRADYHIAVQDLGTNLRRMGLATALSRLEPRPNADKPPLLLTHLAEANIVGLGTDAKQLPARARELDDLASYMLATRELLRLATWFKRAAQAIFTDDDHAS